MIIYDVPKSFQPPYNSKYPGYSSGKNIEEIFFELFKENKENIQSEYIYLPIFWTSIYVKRNYAQNIDDLYEFLESLDKTKKYFTIVQYACGIFVRNFELNLTVFTAGGGGVNIKSETMKRLNYFNLTREIFVGKKGDYDIPLICKPPFPEIETEKTIFCSFMGRFDTHFSRILMHKHLHKNDKIKFFSSLGFSEYKTTLNKSIFTLAPRGFGYTSFRIYEAIIANSIPIYIWDKEKILPFSDEIDWEKFAIIIHYKDLDKLNEILEKVNVKEMQNNLKKIKHFFCFDETFKYILRKISI